jgi:hypothetical protein
MALAVVAAVPALFIAATAAPASAHVLKTVGPYHLLIGFGSEPSYAGMQNSVFLLLTNAKSGVPIVDEGLGDTLKVEVGFGTQKKLLPLVSSYDPDSGQGTKGVYNAYFIPTVRRLHLPFRKKNPPQDEGGHHREVVADDVRRAHDPAAIEFRSRRRRTRSWRSARTPSRPGWPSGIRQPAPKRPRPALIVGIAGLVVGVVGLQAGGSPSPAARHRPGARAASNNPARVE